MAGDGVTTKLQKEVTIIQQKIRKIQNELSQLDLKWDAKMEDHFQRFKDSQMEMHSLFGKYMGNTTVASVLTTAQAKGKGVLGGPPLEFPTKDSLKALPQIMGQLDPNPPTTRFYLEHGYRLECPRFDDTNFRSWWSKLEPFFTAEGILEGNKVMTMMLHLEDRALDWHHFYA